MSKILIIDDDLDILETTGSLLWSTRASKSIPPIPWRRV